MKEYKGKHKTILGLGIAIGILGAAALTTLLIYGANWITILISGFVAFIISFLYKGLILKITIDQDSIKIYKPLSIKNIKFKNIAFCMIHGINETDSIIYAFVKMRRGKTTKVRGIKQDISFEEAVRTINRAHENLDLDINFNMAEKIPVSLVEDTEDLKNEILTTLGGHQKKILNNL